jgi:hypothetical protein
MTASRPERRPQRRHRSTVYLPLLASLALPAGCGPESPLERVEHSGPITETFALSEFFTPSGHMGDGQTLGHITVDVGSPCKERPAGSRGDCYRFSYLPGALAWAGVYWVFPANNWGSRPGRSITGAAFKQVRFWVASELEGLAANFIVGGIADPTLPNRDRVSAVTSESVSREWKQVRLDIAGQDFNQVIGAFAWSLAYPATVDPTGTQPVVLYLDDVVWDTEPVPVPPP